jgi:hypothetical protein
MKFRDIKVGQCFILENGHYYIKIHPIGVDGNTMDIYGSSEYNRWIFGATTFHDANDDCNPFPVPKFLFKQIIGDIFDDYWGNR